MSKSSNMAMDSGQIIATSHDRFPPNGGDCKGNPRKFQGNLGWVKYCCPDRRLVVWCFLVENKGSNF